LNAFLNNDQGNYEEEEKSEVETELCEKEENDELFVSKDFIDEKVKLEKAKYEDEDISDAESDDYKDEEAEEEEENDEVYTLFFDFYI
jgi:hypothetical protein